MKRLLIIALCLLLTACASKKKITQETHVSDSIASAMQMHSETESTLNEHTDEQTQVIVTEIEFFEPSPSDTSTTANSQVNITISPSGEISGSTKGIKSIKQTTTVTQTEQTTEIHESSIQDTIASVVATSQADMEMHTEKKSNTFQYQLPFLVLGVVIIGLLYLKRKPIIDFIKKILIGIVKVITKE